MNEYNIVKFNDNITCINEADVRSFLIEGSDSALLIDTGYTIKGMSKIVNNLTSLPVTVVITHADPDHIMNNKDFDQVLMHPSEFAHYATRCGQINTKTLPLWEGDILDLGGISFEVIHIPGHSPGSIALLDRENRLLIGGDSIQEGPIFMHGAHRSINAMASSMNKLMNYLPSFDTILPSHHKMPLKSDYVKYILDGTIKLINGELEPQELDEDCPYKHFPDTIKLFTWEKVQFYFDLKEYSKMK
jgi:glyoxylase-like metal-dependent hydrolase (beta-lactamase superfamily II)